MQAVKKAVVKQFDKTIFLVYRFLVKVKSSRAFFEYMQYCQGMGDFSKNLLSFLVANQSNNERRETLDILWWCQASHTAHTHNRIKDRKEGEKAV